VLVIVDVFCLDCALAECNSDVDGCATVLPDAVGRISVTVEIDEVDGGADVVVEAVEAVEASYVVDVRGVIGNVSFVTALDGV
jgi:hypothetical protein